MKKQSKKETTIDDLALMVGKGFSEVHEKFSKIDERFDKVDERFDKVDKRFTTIEDSLVKIRGDITSLGDRYVSRFEFDKLLMRFMKFEEKVMDKIGK